MTEGPGPGDPGGVGSVGEEAARLFGALQDWARTAGAGGPAEAGAGLGTAFRHVDEHIATGEESCTYCPVCQIITRLRATSPEVRLHLAVAAQSLLEAAAGMLETRVPPASRSSRVQHIDLDEPGSAEGAADAGRAGPAGWDAE